MGLTFDKILFLGLLAAIVIGPTRLPEAAAQLAKFVRLLRESLGSAKDSVREAGGPDLDNVDWTRLDPRQYDPRRILKEALLDPVPARTVDQSAPHNPSQPLLPTAFASATTEPEDGPETTMKRSPGTTSEQPAQPDADSSHVT